MASLSLLLVGLFAGAAARSQKASGASNPVEKVVTLLKDLQTSLDKDEKAEQSVYDKYACWCEETTARKAKAIEDAKAQLKSFGQDILKLKGTVAVRTDEIEELKAKVKENEEAQEEATMARSKENAAWQAESEETKQALAAINTAMGVLMKATKPSLLQQDATAKLQSSVASVIAAAPTAAIAKLSPARLEKLRGFVSSLPQLKGKAGYAPQSMTIQGILSDMYTTMGVDLQGATAAEAKKNRGFEDFMAEKDKELAKLKQMSTKKQREKTEAAAMLAETTEAYDDVSKQLKADVDFFDVTKGACEDKTKEWQVRSDLRKDELKGVEEALKILTSDEAKKLFEKSIKPGLEKTLLLQTGARAAPLKQKQRKQVNLDELYAKLKERASKSHSLRLAALAAQVRMAKAGHFDKVIKSIDDLIATLGREQESDTKKRNDCEEQYQDIAQESAKLDWKIKNNEAKVAKLQSLIDKREEEKTQTLKEIKETQDSIKDMKDERKKENAAFLQAKKDDLAAIGLMEQAKDMLMKFYQKNDVKMGPIQGSVKLLQETASPMEDPDKAPDAAFSGKGKRKVQSKGIVSIMTMIIEDLNAEVANGVKAEEGAQLSFEKALATAESLLKDLEAKKVSLEEAIAKRKKDKTEEEKDKKANENDLDEQKKEKTSIKTDCDYMIEKYSERRKYRDAEVAALGEAKEFLATYFDGADAELVQQAPARVSFGHLASPRLRG